MTRWRVTSLRTGATVLVDEAAYAHDAWRTAGLSDERGRLPFSAVRVERADQTSAGSGGHDAGTSPPAPAPIPIRQDDLRAWRVVVVGVESIVLARSRSQAKAAVVRSATEAGYDVTFRTPAAIRRAPEFDRLDERPGRALRPEFAADELARLNGGRNGHKHPKAEVSR